LYTAYSTNNYKLNSNHIILSNVYTFLDIESNIAQMGGSASKTETLTSVMNKTAIEVMIKNSSEVSTSSVQENKIVMANISGSKISGIKQINSAKINTKALSSSTSDGKLQSEMAAALTETIKQESPAIGFSSDKIISKSEIENIVNSELNMESLNKITSSVEQNNEVLYTGIDTSTIKNIQQKNEAKQIAELVNKMNNKIVAKLTNKSTIDKRITQTSKDLFSFGNIIFVIIMGLLGAAAYTFSEYRYIILGIALVLIFLYLILPMFSSSSSFADRARPIILSGIPSNNGISGVIYDGGNNMKNKSDKNTISPFIVSNLNKIKNKIKNKNKNTIKNKIKNKIKISEKMRQRHINKSISKFSDLEELHEEILGLGA
jgi:hypothetical protein